MPIIICGIISISKHRFIFYPDTAGLRSGLFPIRPTFPWIQLRRKSKTFPSNRIITGTRYPKLSIQRTKKTVLWLSIALGSILQRPPGKYRWQLQLPASTLSVISLDYSVNHISLPSAYNSVDLILVSPKFDFTFSRKLFWTTYIQYNNQINNVNINSRLQWRFKPASDLYFVYTDNYFAETNSHGDFLYVGQPKLRALVVKLTYWLNL